MRAVAGNHEATVALDGSQDERACGRKIGERAEETEAGSASVVWVPAVDKSDRIHTVMNDTADRRPQGEQFLRIEVTDEHAVLHGPTEALHRLVNLPKTHRIADVVADKMSLAGRHRSPRHKRNVIGDLAQ